MTDEQSNDQPSNRPAYSTIPGRAPIREVRESGAAAIQRELNDRDPPTKAVALRSQARRDAVTAVSRARERAGAQRTNWSAIDADAVHAITDLLLLVQGQGAPATESALADRA